MLQTTIAQISQIAKIFSKFDRKDSSSIRSVQELFSVTMSRNLAYIKANYCAISQSIARLETVGMQLWNAINIVNQTESELSGVQGQVANKINAKLQSMLERNPGYSTLCKVSGILCGNEAELGGNEQGLSANDLTLFKYSPVMSCDVERSFSSYSIRFYLVTIGGPSSLAILKCMSSSTATLPKTKAKLRYVFHYC